MEKDEEHTHNYLSLTDGFDYVSDSETSSPSRIMSRMRPHQAAETSTLNNTDMTLSYNDEKMEVSHFL